MPFEMSQGPACADTAGTTLAPQEGVTMKADPALRQATTDGALMGQVLALRGGSSAR